MGGGRRPVGVAEHVIAGEATAVTVHVVAAGVERADIAVKESPPARAAV